jgi:hypothetical protein
VSRRRWRRVVAVALAGIVLAACTGTFTPGAATLYLVFLDPSPGQSARVALLAFEATPTDRRLDLLNASAYAFAPGETVIAVDVLDRENRDEAWVLTAVGAGSRAVRLHRLDLRAVSDQPGEVLTPAAPVRDLTATDGSWIGLTGASTGCLSELVAGPGGASLALWDAGSAGRCEPIAETVDPRVHVIDLAAGTVRTTFDVAPAPGVRPADPGDPAALWLVRRPAVGGLDVREVLGVTFAAPDPRPFESGEPIEGLRDLVGIPGGFAALRDTGTGTRGLAIVVGDVVTERPAPAGATRVHADLTGRLANLLTTGGGRLGVVYPGESALREIAFDANSVTVEPLNAYALAVRASGGLCLVDLLVPTTSTGCDLALDPVLAEALPAPRFVTWTYAAPSAP